MVKFGTFSFPRVLQLQEDVPRIPVEKPPPGRAWAYRDDLGGLGAHFTLQGEIIPADDDIRDQIAALADCVARIFDPQYTTPEYFESAQLYDGVIRKDKPEAFGWNRNHASWRNESRWGLDWQI